MNHFNQNASNIAPQFHTSEANNTSEQNTQNAPQEELTPTQRQMQKLMEKIEKLKEKEAKERQKAQEKQEKEVLAMLKKAGIFKHTPKQIEKSLPQIMQILNSQQ